MEKQTTINQHYVPRFYMKNFSEVKIRLAELGKPLVGSPGTLGKVVSDECSRDRCRPGRTTMTHFFKPHPSSSDLEAERAHLNRFRIKTALRFDECINFEFTLSTYISRESALFCQTRRLTCSPA